MKRTLATAIAVSLGAAGVAEATPASATETARPASLEQVRADAMARLRSGDIQTVDRRGRGHWRGGHRSWRHGGWRGRRHYSGRRYYYGRRHHHGSGAAIAAGAAGLVAGAIIADSARRPAAPGKRWCASHYKSYDWGSSTYLGYDGRRHSCP